MTKAPPVDRHFISWAEKILGLALVILLLVAIDTRIQQNERSHENVEAICLARAQIELALLPQQARLEFPDDYAQTVCGAAGG